MQENNLTILKNMIQETFDSVSKVIGIHVMLLILEHALWKTGQKYEEAALINFSENGITLNEIENLQPERARLIIYELMISIITTLGNLVGKQLANNLMKQLNRIREVTHFEQNSDRDNLV